MPEYRRAHPSGGTLFLTIVTYERVPLFADPENVARLRRALTAVGHEWPFQTPAAVVLPDHVHFLWTLPAGDAGYSKRVGRLKTVFTKSLRSDGGPRTPSRTTSPSRQKHHEADVWQRRFWEHTIRDEDDLERHLHYIHCNPVKHGLVACPHLWPYSSFHRWVRSGSYAAAWACCCDGRRPPALDFTQIEQLAGEWL